MISQADCHPESSVPRGLSTRPQPSPDRCLSDREQSSAPSKSFDCFSLCPSLYFFLFFCLHVSLALSISFPSIPVSLSLFFSYSPNKRLPPYLPPSLSLFPLFSLSLAPSPAISTVEGRCLWAVSRR